MTRAQIAILATLAFPAVASGDEPRWYVATAMDDVILGAEGRTFDIGSGWSCAVSPPSTFNARTTICRKGSEAFEFSVQCFAPANADHVQIRFPGSNDARNYIEVGCRSSDIHDPGTQQRN
jgi:hypothetical protein